MDNFVLRGLRFMKGCKVPKALNQTPENSARSGQTEKQNASGPWPPPRELASAFAAQQPY